MRNYLYIWNEPTQNFIVASGIEFKDFIGFENMRTYGFVFLSDESDYAEYDEVSGFRYAVGNVIEKILSENIYDWGDCIWADFKEKNSANK